MLEAEGGAVPTVSSLYPSKERCLWSPVVAEGGGRRRRAAEGGGGRQRLEDEYSVVSIMSLETLLWLILSLKLIKQERCT